MANIVFLKYATSVLDYQIDWSTWLGTDTISTSTWAADTGLTVDSESETTTSATVWISGGTVDAVYKLINTIVTAGGRTKEQVIHIQVVDLE